MNTISSKEQEGRYIQPPIFYLTEEQCQEDKILNVMEDYKEIIEDHPIVVFKLMSKSKYITSELVECQSYEMRKVSNGNISSIIYVPTMKNMKQPVTKRGEISHEELENYFSSDLQSSVANVTSGNFQFSHSMMNSESEESKKIKKSNLLLEEILTFTPLTQTEPQFLNLNDRG